MSIFFVSRHTGALEWAAQNNIHAEQIINAIHLDLALVQPGDTVIGTLPVHLVAEVCRNGASYQHLVLDIPSEWRGQELTSEQMNQCHARLEEYRAVLAGVQQVASLTELPSGQDSVQFCIASEQIEANYIGAAQLRPRKVYILASNVPHIIDAATRLERALQAIGIPSETLDSLPTSDPLQLREYAFTLAKMVREMEPETHLTLNSTGGKKIMSFALSQAFMATANASVIYIDSESETLQVLSPWDMPNQPIQPDLIDIASALELRGYQIVSKETDSKQWQDHALGRANLTNWLAQMAGQLSYFFSCLNAAAFNAKNQPNGVPLLALNGNTFRPDVNARNALQGIAAAGLATWDESSQLIQFSSEDTRAYLNGKWLEEFTWLVLRKVSGGDCAGGIKINSQTNQAIDNEIDLTLAWHNRLFMVECKTKNMKKADVGNQDLYRIDSLQKQLGGSFATSLLLSAKPLDPPADQRARQNRVLILTGSKMIKLSHVAKMWQEGQSITAIQQWIDQLETEALLTSS